MQNAGLWKKTPQAAQREQLKFLFCADFLTEAYILGPHRPHCNLSLENEMENRATMNKPFYFIPVVTIKDYSLQTSSRAYRLVLGDYSNFPCVSN